MVEPWMDFRNFLGVNNMADPLRIPVGKGGTYLEVGENIDIDDEKMMHRRKGFESVLSGDVRSLWSNGKYCFFCEGIYLKRLFEDYKTGILLSILKSEEKMNFIEADGTIYFSNRSIVGYIEDGQPHPFPNPNFKFKKRMVGGHLIEFYNSRLYAAQGSKVFFSDATQPMRMDMRKNFLQFSGWITMIKGIKDGLYVGAGDDVFFLLGGDPLLEGGFVYDKVTDSKVIEGSAISIEGEDVGPGLLGRTALWASEDGIYLGLPGGQVKEVTKGTYGVKDGEKATAIYKWDRGFGQYLCLYEKVEGTGGGEINLTMSMPSIEMVGH